MANTIVLNLEKREEVGKNHVNKLRKEEITPGVLYAAGKESLNVKVPEKNLVKVYEQVGTSAIFEVNVDGDTSMALFKEIQRNPIKNQVTHFDLMEVDMSEKIRVVIPIVLEGKEDIKVQPSNLIQVLDEIEVECLPNDLPSETIINISEMEIGDVISVKDLDIFSNEKIEIFAEDDETVATLQDIVDVVEEVEEVIEASEVPTVDETEE